MELLGLFLTPHLILGLCQRTNGYTLSQYITVLAYICISTLNKVPAKHFLEHFSILTNLFISVHVSMVGTQITRQDMKTKSASTTVRSLLTKSNGSTKSGRL